VCVGLLARACVCKYVCVCVCVNVCVCVQDLLREILEVKRSAKDEADTQRKLADREISRVRDEAIRTTETLQAELSDTQAQLQDALRRYHARESRTEDMALITELKGLIIQQQALIQKQEQDMKFFKLELMNREENFNHRFARDDKVRVGVMSTGVKPKDDSIGTTPRLSSVGMFMGSRSIHWFFFLNSRAFTRMCVCVCMCVHARVCVQP
jgi:hypothetical protein